MTKLTRRRTLHRSNEPRKKHADTHGVRLTREMLVKGTTILQTNNDSHQLQILEALYIKEKNSALNSQLSDMSVIPSLRNLDPSLEDVEVLAVIIKLPEYQLHLYNIQRSQQANLEIDELLGLAATKPVIIAGDFNAHHPMLASRLRTNATGLHLNQALRESRDAARASVPLSNGHTKVYRDRWIYGPQVKELNRRVIEARKDYRSRPNTPTRQYLRSMVHHARATKTKLRNKAWTEWCQGINLHALLEEMWKRVRSLYKPCATAPATHSDPQAEAERLAALFAACFSSSLLPVSTRQLQLDLAPKRCWVVHTSYGQDTASDSHFTVQELALHTCSDTTAGQDKISYSMLAHLYFQGKNTFLSLFNASVAAGALSSE
ncbi:hypothetical protein Pcinc_012354 [Petrolisthes cinctipes]|uniref:Endonuclease/exonuclease/phosphatase domain-containing protein n=1 Tax=Petrolisthes cinctipes TaxID=88211 RepID=A0AAE1FZ09_PETCI|nr:hypothetical protein Pcinc_012354 [Petrolisthes cinctipes]